jgi:hypothetical protein
MHSKRYDTILADLDRVRETLLSNLTKVDSGAAVEIGTQYVDQKRKC